MDNGMTGTRDPVTIAPVDRVLLFDPHGGREGHRGELYDVLDKLFRISSSRSLAAALLAREPVLIPMIEAEPLRYVVLAALRSLVGRTTAGFLLRPKPLFAPVSVRHRLKRLALRWLKRFPGASTISFLPFDVEPRLADVATHWIYDPQFWDLHYPQDVTHQVAGGELTRTAKADAGGRTICAALGRQDESKGFEGFASLYASRADLRDRFLFVVGGSVIPALQGEVERLRACGGMVLNRFIERAELFDLYYGADLVWCCYVPTYDQSSGVFGRAVQLGIPVVVRAGSMIETYCRTHQVAHIAFGGNSPDFPTDWQPQRGDLGEAGRTARHQGGISVRNLRHALRLTPA